MGIAMGPATAMRMRGLRKTGSHFARLALFGALICTTAIRSVAGDAIVLHEHGLQRAHLHVMSYTELLHNAAWSHRFGHLPTLPLAAPCATSGIHILAVVITGPTLAPESNGPEDDLLSQGSAISIDGAFDMPRTTSFGRADLNPQARTASTAILLRNHSLLL